MKNKKNLLVTLADENYIDQAKQLFSSVYWNAGWKGDYMLLAHEIPEKKLRWFRKKGILVKKCKPIINEKPEQHPTYLKFYLFTPEFKKWKNVVYLDADIIIRASLYKLTKVKGFAAVLDDLIVNKLIDQFIIPSQMGKKTFNELKKRYSFSSKTFNAGVIAFNTDIIKKNTFLKLKKLFERYKELRKPGVVDQPILNLFFYKKWKGLPIVYNLDIRDFKFIQQKKIKAIIFHFGGKNKPWLSGNSFYNEWKFNLKRANKINLNNIQLSKQLKPSEIKNYSRYLKVKSIFYLPNLAKFIDYQIGSIGIFLYNHFPRLYFKLKSLKDFKLKN